MTIPRLLACTIALCLLASALPAHAQEDDEMEMRPKKKKKKKKRRRKPKRKADDEVPPDLFPEDEKPKATPKSETAPDLEPEKTKSENPDSAPKTEMPDEPKARPTTNSAAPRSISKIPEPDILPSIFSEPIHGEVMRGASFAAGIGSEFIVGPTTITNRPRFTNPGVIMFGMFGYDLSESLAINLRVSAMINGAPDAHSMAGEVYAFEAGARYQVPFAWFVAYGELDLGLGILPQVVPPPSDTTSSGAPMSISGVGGGAIGLELHMLKKTFALNIELRATYLGLLGVGQDNAPSPAVALQGNAMFKHFF